MFEDADAALERILTLVGKCPEALQGKCFEMLLGAYLNSKSKSAKPEPNLDDATNRNAGGDQGAVVEIPEIVRGRFNTAVARLKVKADRLSALFDFQQDPFTYHGVAVPGDGKAPKTRNVALLLAFKSYLATGTWTADWKEFRAMCVDQSCYDRANSGTFLSRSGYCKVATSADGITLNSNGVTAAESLVSALAGGTLQNDPGQ